LEFDGNLQLEPKFHGVTMFTSENLGPIASRNHVFLGNKGHICPKQPSFPRPIAQPKLHSNGPKLLSSGPKLPWATMLPWGAWGNHVCLGELGSIYFRIPLFSKELGPICLKNPCFMGPLNGELRCNGLKLPGAIMFPQGNLDQPFLVGN
jgi:hypothetical protein